MPTEQSVLRKLYTAKRVKSNKNLSDRIEALKEQVGAPSNQDLIDLVLVVLEYIKQVDTAVRAGKLQGEPGKDGKDGRDGATPLADVHYASKATTQKQVNALMAEAVRTIQSQIQQPKDGKDAVITPEVIQQTAEQAYKLLKLPDFTSLITQEPQAIRDALELLQGEERISISAIKELEEVLKDLEERMVQTQQAGGTSIGAMRRYVDSKTYTFKGLTDVTISATQPSNPAVGDVWVDIS